MIFIYNCYAGTHSSSLASAIHLKKLPEDRMPTKEEILNTDYFDKLKCEDIGRVIYRGTDDEGNKVYSMGRGSSKLVVPCIANVIHVLCDEYGFKEKVIFSNMNPGIPLAMMVGGFVSRRFGLKSIGTPFLVMGAKQAYHKIVKIVHETRKSAKASNNHVLILTNENVLDEKCQKDQSTR